MAFSLEYEVLLNLLSNSLFETKIKLPDDINWEKVLNESLKQAVVAIAFDGLKNIDVPKEIKEKWFMCVVRNIQINHMINAQHTALHKLMSENDIPYCILKGSASAYYYPDPTFRSMGDVDFFVPKKNFKKAIKCFLDNGFVTRGEKEEVHTVFRKANTNLEMHFEPPGIPPGEKRVIIEKYFKDLIEKSQVQGFINYEFYNPDKFHHGLILLLHTCHHLLREGIGLRHLCDWAVFVNSFKDYEFSDMFKEKLEAIGMWKFACILTNAAVKYLNLPQPEGVVCDFAKYEDLMNDIYTGGNFGKKTKDRYFQSLYISSNGVKTKNSGKLRQFIETINDILYLKFKWLHKFTVLLPLFWIVFGGRYVFRLLRGKRKAILTKEILNSAEERNNIYKDFHLFGCEE